jgi:putative sterol carrier protein
VLGVDGITWVIVPAGSAEGTTFTLQSLHWLNLDWEADEFMQFVADLEPNEDGSLQLMYGIDGRRDLTESRRHDLSGYAERAQCASATAPSTNVRTTREPRGQVMTDATAAFFDSLVERGHEPLLGNSSGTVRFDLTAGTKTERWLVAIVNGDLAVSRRNRRADCVVTADKSLFDGIASGETNAMAALLRGAMRVTGDVRILVHFQRLLPGPPASRRARRVAAPDGRER